MPSTSFARTLLTLVVLLCVCTSSAAAIVDRGADDAADTACFPSVDSVERGEAVGDVVEVETLLCFSGSVTISGPGYTGTATLGDGNGSGHVTLQLNTGVNGSDAFSVSDGRIPTNATGNGSFQPGNYTVTVRDGGGDVVDTVPFQLSEPRAQDLTVFRGPRGAAADLQSVEAIGDVRSVSRNDSSRRLDDPDTTEYLPLATNETLLVAVRADGLEGVMADTDGSPLSRFRKALREQGGTLSFRQTDETVTPSRRPLDPDVLNSSATHLVAGAATDTYYLVIDTERLWGEWGGTSGGPVRIGSSVGSGYTVQFSMNGSIHRDTRPADRVGADFRIVEPAMNDPRYASERQVALEPGNVTVVGRTTLAPGTTLTANVSGLPDETVQRTVRVEQLGSGPAVQLPLDLSTVPTGTSLTIGFERDGKTVDGTLQAIVRESGGSDERTSSVTASSTPTATSTPVDTPTPTSGSAPGFGVIASLSGLLIAVRQLSR